MPSDYAERPARGGVRLWRELLRLREILTRDLFLTTTASCFLLVLPISVVLQNGMASDGDGPLYFAVQQAFIDHGTPSLPSAAIAELERRLNVSDILDDGRVIRGEDGEIYGVHFWLYPLLSTPFAVPFKLLGLSTLYAFLLLNIACLALCAFVLHRAKALGTAGKCVTLFSLSITTINWYGSWPHPEVFTACMLVSATVLLLDRRYALSGILSALAATQNPSAVLMFGAIAAFRLEEALRDRDASGHFTAAMTFAARMAPGILIAATPVLWSWTKFGVLNPIAGNGYIDYAQICWAKFVSLFFDWNQGFVIGFPFLLTSLAAVLAVRAIATRKQRSWPFAIEDVLILTTITMAIPVLAQMNFNAGQHYVSRYVSWLAAPAIVWAAVEIDREVRLTALKAWAVGIGLYASFYIAYFTQKLVYVLTIAPKEARVYEDQTLFKPIAALILSFMPATYDPWPEIFIERALHREVSLSPNDGAPATVGYKVWDDHFAKIITKAKSPDEVSHALCPQGMLLVDRNGHKVSFDDATEPGLGYRYLSGRFFCR